jgi:hypothetical protein
MSLSPNMKAGRLTCDPKLAINLTTAKALGLTVPPTLLTLSGHCLVFMVAPPPFRTDA